MFSLIEAGERAGSGIPVMVDQWMSCGYGKPRLSEAVDLSRTRVNQLLRALVEGGIVEAIGGSHNRVYRLAGK